MGLFYYSKNVHSNGNYHNNSRAVISTNHQQVLPGKFIYNVLI